MMAVVRSVSLLILLLTTNTGLAQNITSLLDNGASSGAFWSVSVRDAEGNMLEAHHSDNLIVPASNQKLFTTAAVLNGLGSDYTFTTKMYADGSIRDSVLIGDLIIEGSGDPSISGIFYNDDREYVFSSFAHQLRTSGINAIQGAVVADISRFDDQPFPKGWDWDDLSF